MSMLNPFATDAFNMTALTAAINKIPNTYGRLEQLNLMTPQGVRTRTIIIEEMSGVLNLLPTQPVGAPGTVGTQGKRKVRSFVIPHIAHDDAMLPEEVQGGSGRNQGEGQRQQAQGDELRSDERAGEGDPGGGESHVGAG